MKPIHFFVALTALIILLYVLWESPGAFREADRQMCQPVASAFDEYPEFASRSESALLMRPDSNLINGIVGWFPCEGDSEGWFSNREKYPWNMLLGTQAFILQAYKEAISKGLINLGRQTYLDVGTNMGQEAIMVANLGVKVVTFELQARCARRAQFNFRLNCVSERVVLKHMGVSDKRGSIFIAEKGFTAGQGLSRLKESSGSGTKVQLETLDAVLLNDAEPLVHSSPLILKIDCEGCELKALKGATKLFKEMPPYYLLIELFTSTNIKDADPILELLEAAGYDKKYILDSADSKVNQQHPVSYFGPDLVTRPLTSTSKRTWCDVVFVHKSAPSLWNL